MSYKDGAFHSKMACLKVASFYKGKTTMLSIFNLVVSFGA